MPQKEKKMRDVFSEISLTTVEKFKFARYVIISPNPEDDVMGYMERWAKNSGLLHYPGYTPRMIGWDFPFVSEEQKSSMDCGDMWRHISFRRSLNPPAAEQNWAIRRQIIMLK